MIKTFLFIFGGLLALANTVVLFEPSLQKAVTFHSIVVGALVLVLALCLTPRAPSVPTDDASTPATPPVAPPPPAPVRAEAEVVAFLALLQEKGRLVDFVKEEIAAASDEQIGAAARVVHEGCRKVIGDYFDITPLRSESEGSILELKDGYEATAYRLIGSVPDRPPYRGRLIHPGWEARAVRLPRLEGGSKREWPVVAPAEVEIA